jgi:hypothetical protein
MSPHYSELGPNLFRIFRIGFKIKTNTASSHFRVSFLVALVHAWCLLFAVNGKAQSLDYSNCPDCSSADFSLYTEVMTKYQGLKGTNPSAPSTYRLIGRHKYNGGGYGPLNSAFGNNWYPIRVEKQIFSGVLHFFGVSNWGNESDWNIYLRASDGFEDFISAAIPYKIDNWYGHDTWKTASDGRYLLEAEIPGFQTAIKRVPSSTNGCVCMVRLCVKKHMGTILRSTRANKFGGKKETMHTLYYWSPMLPSALTASTIMTPLE